MRHSGTTESHRFPCKARRIKVVEHSLEGFLLSCLLCFVVLRFLQTPRPPRRLFDLTFLHPCLLFLLRALNFIGICLAIYTDCSLLTAPRRDFRNGRTENAEELTAKAEHSSAAAPETTTATVQVAKEGHATTSTCHRCGYRGHTPSSCRLRSATCNHYRKQGHIQRPCKAKKNKREAKPKPEYQAALVDDEFEDETLELQYLYHKEETVNSLASTRKPWITPVKVDGKQSDMEIDTGASVFLISEATYKSIWRKQRPALRTASATLRTYTGEQIPVVGKIVMNASMKQCRRGMNLPLFVVRGDGPSLCVRDRLAQLKMDWASSHMVLRMESTGLDEILKRYAEVFQEELGCLKGVEVKIHIDPQAATRYHRVHTVPHAMREQVEEALFKLVSSGVIESVKGSEWAAPIVRGKSRRKCTGLRGLQTDCEPGIKG